MPDLSMDEVPPRFAIAGELLVTYRFPAGRIGLASPNETGWAHPRSLRHAPRLSFWKTLKRTFEILLRPDRPRPVVVLSGARLRILSVPARLADEFDLESVTDATFLRLAAGRDTPEDAIRFSNGRHILLQRLAPWTLFTVLTNGEDPLDEILDAPCGHEHWEREPTPFVTR
jgi:hypothetical protein